MGQFLPAPKTDKESADDVDEASGIRYGVTSMQGWRAGMEDAHLCNLDFDNGRKLFGVFDGHAGPEVAKYLALHLGEFLEKNEVYSSCRKNKDVDVSKIGKALVETFMAIDAHLLTEECMEELTELSDDKPQRGSCDNTDDEKEEAEELVNEANLSLPELLAKYGKALDNDDEEGEGADKAKQAKKHLSALAQKIGYNIDFGLAEDEDDEENGDEEAAPSENGGKKSDETSSAADSETSSGRRGRKAKKPSKAEAGPVDVLPSSDTTTDASKAEKKTEKAVSAAEEGTDDSEAGSDSSDDADFDADSATADACADDDDENEDEEDDDDDDDDDQDSDDDDEEDDSDDEEEEEDEEEDNMEDSVISTGGDDEDEEFPACVGKSSGSTAVAALICGDKLIVANTGDSRCVLCRGGEAVAMSEDHQPELEAERARVERAGGFVSEYGRVNNGLNMSRAIGDHHYKTNTDLSPEEQMISALPDIRTETLTDEDEFMILACDGIWNCMSNEECVKFVRKRLLKRGAATCLSAICEEACDYCLAPDISGDGTGSDNMTMMVVLLKKDLSVPQVSRKKKRHSDAAAAASEDADAPAEASSTPAKKRRRRAR